jgi:hypothetical protein
MPLSSTRRTFLLLCVLAAGAFIAAIALIHAAGASRDADSPISVSRAAKYRSDSVPATNAAGLHSTGVWANPAAQRPGPPDPVTEQSAAVSAEHAAKVAADLAAAAGPAN